MTSTVRLETADGPRPHLVVITQHREGDTAPTSIRNPETMIPVEWAYVGGATWVARVYFTRRDLAEAHALGASAMTDCEVDPVQASSCRHLKVVYDGDTSSGESEWVRCTTCGKRWTEGFPG